MPFGAATAVLYTSTGVSDAKSATNGQRVRLHSRTFLAAKVTIPAQRMAPKILIT
jgi:hypothetical protein